MNSKPVNHVDLHTKLATFVDDLIDHQIDLALAKRELEVAYIKRILSQNKRNIGLSAKSLGIHRNTLSRRMKDLNIRRN